MQRLADQLVCDVGAIVVAGVDMVYALGDCCAQHGQRRVTIFGRAKHAGAGKLHGAIAQPLHHALAKRERGRLIHCGHVDLLSRLRKPGVARGYHSIGRRRCRGRVCFIAARGDTEDQRRIAVTAGGQFAGEVAYARAVFKANCDKCAAACSAKAEICGVSIRSSAKAARRCYYSDCCLMGFRPRRRSERAREPRDLPSSPTNATAALRWHASVVIPTLVSHGRLY